MKKYIFILMAVCLSSVAFVNEVKAAPDSPKTPTAAQLAEAKVLESRLEEIKSLDRSTLSKSERKALRKEVRSIDKKLRDIGGGVYISAGALIVILILIILFT